VSFDALFARNSESWLDGIVANLPPSLFVASEDGGYWTYPPFESKVTYLFELVPPPSVEVTICGADHMDYDPAAIFPRFFAPPGSADEVEVRAIASRYAIAWFGLILQDDGASWESYISGAKAQADIESGKVMIRTRLVAPD